MRLDKFLKISRLIKRRPLAKTLADSGRVKINGAVAKASTKVTLGDHLAIEYGDRLVQIEVLKLLDSTKKDDAKYMYQIINEQKKERDSHE